jgi:hypothetical protein
MDGIIVLFDIPSSYVAQRIDTSPIGLDKSMQKQRRVVFLSLAFRNIV